MMSQAYMLVYIRKSEIERNLMKIEMDEVEDHIKEKVEKESAEIKMNEFYNKHRIIYLILPEMLVGKSFEECILSFDAHLNTDERMENFYKDPSMRYCMVLQREDSIEEFYNVLCHKLGLEISDLFVYTYNPPIRNFIPFLGSYEIKFDHNTNEIKLLTKKFRPRNSIYIMYIEVINEKKKHNHNFITRVPRNSVVGFKNPLLQDNLKHINEYGLVRYEGNEDVTDVESMFEKYRNIIDKKLTLCILKQFQGMRSVFQESLLVDNNSTVSDEVMKKYNPSRVFFEFLDEFRVDSSFPYFLTCRIHPVDYDSTEDIQDVSISRISKEALNFLYMRVLVCVKDEKQAREYLNHHIEVNSRIVVTIRDEENMSEDGGINQIINMNYNFKEIIEYIGNKYLAGIQFERVGINLQIESGQKTEKTFFYDDEAASTCLHSFLEVLRGKISISYFKLNFPCKDLVAKLEVAYKYVLYTGKATVDLSSLFDRSLPVSNFLEHMGDILSDDHAENVRMYQKNMKNDLVEIEYVRFYSIVDFTA